MIQIEETIKAILISCRISSETDAEYIEAIEKIKQQIDNESPLKSQPVNRVRWIPIEKVCPNDYNPNSVAKIEMGLLYTSIKHDGYTQPIVTIYDEENDKYVIVDGFHRYFTCLTNQDIRERNHGYLPIVVIEKDINDRMASTVRHNRARGKHSITGMSSMVFEMLQNGWKDEEICNELGMQPEEVLKLKHITGFSKLFSDTEYKRSWEETNQLKLRKQYQDEQKASKE
jgi:ParB-like chromosome segregation protein Spo0J